MKSRHAWTRGDRGSALWGTGTGGGEHRGERPLGARSGKGVVTTAFALVALALPLAATAGGRPGSSGRCSRRAPVKPSYVDPALLEKAKKTPNEKVRIIVRASLGGIARRRTRSSSVGSSGRAAAWQAGAPARPRPGHRARGAGSADRDPRSLSRARDHPRHPAHGDRHEVQQAGLAVRSGPRRVLAGLRVRRRHALPELPDVRPGDRGRRLRASTRSVPTSAVASGAEVDLTSLAPNSPGDGRGHGTFVAGIAAGVGPDYAGAARPRRSSRSTS